MSALLLAGWLCCAQTPDKAELVKELDADFAALVEKERFGQPLRDAAAALQSGDVNARRAYFDVLGSLRKSRSKAAVPLLLKHLLLSDKLQQWDFTACTDTLVLLTGDDAPERRAKGNDPDAAGKLVRQWWRPNKETITTDTDRMSRAQVELIVSRLLRLAEAGSRYDRSGRESTTTFASITSQVSAVRRQGYDRPPFWPEELHPRMVPIFLALAGYDPKAKAGADRETYRVAYAAVPMLAQLRNNGEAPEFDKIADDPQHNSAVRLTCLLALVAAGEDLRTRSLLSLLDAEKNFERRLVAILMLSDSREPALSNRRLLGLLDDGNVHIRQAALQALHGRAPREALPKLKPLLDASATAQSALSTIAAMQTKEAAQVVADYLHATLEDGQRGRMVSYALGAFETVTGQRFGEAGAHNDAYYREKARLALEWWKNQK